MKRFLHGDWLGHPLHPILVHLPVGLWPAALIFDVLSVCGVGGNPMVRCAFWSIVLGIGGALGAAVPGYADWTDIGRDKPARSLGLYHLFLNLTALGIWFANAVVRLGSLDAAATPPLPLALSVLGTLILAAGVYFGMRMVYGQGTYVGWTALGKWRRIAQRGGANVPPEAGT